MKPHILNVTTSPENGLKYFMQLYRTSLHDFIASKAPHEFQLWKDNWGCHQLMSEMLQALDYLAMAGMVHRDAKPMNIPMGDSGKFVLADFGLCNTAANAQTICGTPTYIAPGINLYQLFHYKQTPRANSWSLFITLFWCKDVSFQHLFYCGSYHAEPEKWHAQLRDLVDANIRKPREDVPHIVTSVPVHEHLESGSPSICCAASTWL
jgi:serine/threonine protein kinase